MTTPPNLFLVPTFSCYERLVAIIIDHILINTHWRASVWLLLPNGTTNVLSDIAINKGLLDAVKKIEPTFKALNPTSITRYALPSLDEIKREIQVDTRIHFLVPPASENSRLTPQILKSRYPEITQQLSYEDKNDCVYTIADQPLPPLTKRELLTRPPSYTGDFTIGDLAAPLLRVNIQCFSLTRRESLKYGYFYQDEPVKKITNYEISTGPLTDESKLVNAYNYMGTLLPVTKEMEDLMNGEFPGAEQWHVGFELLATVPEVSPWLTYGYSDYVFGVGVESQEFISTFAASLSSTKMNAIVRYGKKPAEGGKKRAVELLCLRPFENYLIASPLPFKKDYRSFYSFGKIPESPIDDNDDLDVDMNKLVSSMINNDICEPIRDVSISRPLDSARKTLYTNNKLDDWVPKIPESAVIPDLGTYSSTNLDEVNKYSSKLQKALGLKQVEVETSMKRPQNDNYLAPEETQDLSDLL